MGTKYPLTSLIFGFLAFIPYLGILFSGLAIILGIFSISKERMWLPIFGIILGVTGLFAYYLLPLLIFYTTIGYSVLYTLESYGLLSESSSLMGLTLFFFIALFAFLGVVKVNLFWRSIIAHVLAFVIAFVIILLNMFLRLPFNLATIVVQIGAQLSHFIVVLMMLFIPLALLLPKKRFYQISSILAIIFLAVFSIFAKDYAAGWSMNLVIAIILLLFSYPISLILAQYRFLLARVPASIVKVTITLLAAVLIYSSWRITIQLNSFVQMLMVVIIIGTTAWLVVLYRLFLDKDYFRFLDER